MNLVSNNPRILDSQRRTPAHVLALQIMNDIMRMRFPDFGKADDFDKKHLRERFEEWLSEHSFPKSLTSPQVEVDQVILLRSSLNSTLYPAEASRCR